MSTETQVVTVEDISADKAPAIFGHNKLSAYVEAARAAANEVPDLSTRKGRDRVASLASQVSRSKTAVEKPGRDYLKRIKELPKAIETELREFVQQMDALRDEVRRPLTEWEEKEAARVAEHERRIEELRCTNTDGRTAAEIASAISLIEEVEIGENWEEFEAEAHRVKAASLATLREALARREQYEAEQAELERLRKEVAAREQKEREERIAREAAEAERLAAERRAQEERDAAARREAEAKAAAERRELELRLQAEQAERAAAQAEANRIAAEQRAEQERVAAEERATQAAEAARQAEIRRQADEQARIEREAAAREADRAHKGAVLKAAKEAVMTVGITEDQAREVIKLIAAGGVPQVYIAY
ncbi:hypothetical protein LMK08_16685 [Metapseudomonas furukawaii]|uniref:hypothetical protein n=1 Tax=Metapseudomonas furukawaii TaxID=1149133 RepID=UPI00227D1DC6|nr:hypothetical protein [Pseudomonas furukawaii]WAG77012.1 hypothetical protein LMK08_16685 [Pseudomonas furukawaii]